MIHFRVNLNGILSDLTYSMIGKKLSKGDISQRQQWNSRAWTKKLGRF